jgi:hypothetical protein
VNGQCACPGGQLNCNGVCQECCEASDCGPDEVCWNNGSCVRPCTAECPCTCDLTGNWCIAPGNHCSNQTCTGGTVCPAGQVCTRPNCGDGQYRCTPTCKA